MELLTHQLLDESSAKRICKSISDKDAIWLDGKNTAGTHAAIVKKNLQLDRNSEKSKILSDQIIKSIKSDQLIKSFALPSRLHGLLFSKTSEGQGYGMHVDNAYMSSGRSDLSFTLFLSGPESYSGGELCIQTFQNKKKFKLKPGEIVIYPSTSLHSVEPVTQGQRLVCIGWIQSYISSNEDRETLFLIDSGARGLLATHGRSPQLDLVFLAYNNLLRRFGD